MLYCNWAPYKQVKTLTFLVFANIFTKKGVRVVVDYVFRHTNDYADMNGRFRGLSLTRNISISNVI